jgi:hypothetical protein
MPRDSKRKSMLTSRTEVLEVRQIYRCFRALMDDEDSDEDDLDVMYHLEATVADETRYHLRRTNDLKPLSSEEYYLTAASERKFKYHFRVSREYFTKIEAMVAF